MRGFFLFFVIFPLLAADSFRELPVIRLPGMNGCNALAVSKNYLYAAGGQELVTYEIGEDPLTPRITSRIPVAGARQIALSGDWIFISARHFGIHVLDRRNPAKPLPVSRIEPIELATGIQACGNILFVSLRVYGVELIDVSDPQHPRHLSLLRNCGEIQSLFCYGEGFLAMGDWGGKALRIADVRNPLQPREVSRVNLDGYGDGVWVQRNFCYASTGHHSRARDPEKRFGTGHGLEIFDLSNPGNPVHVSTIKFPPFYELGDDFWTVRVDRGIAYAGDTFNGMFMVDVRDPRNPKCIGRALLPRVKRYSSFRKKTIEEPDCVMDLAIGNNAVYLAGPRTGVFAVPTKSKISTPPAVALSIPERSACREISNLKLHAMDVNVRSLTLWRNDHLFVSCSEGGLFLFRIEGNDLKLLRAWRNKNVYETAVSGQILFAAEGSFLRSYRIRENKTLELIGEVPIPFPHLLKHFRLFEEFSLGIGSGGTGHLFFFRTRNPETITLLERDKGRLLYGDMIPESAINGLIPVNWHRGGIRWYDLRREKHFRLSANPSLRCGQLSGVTRVKDRFVVPGKNLYLLLDPQNPSSGQRCAGPDSGLQGIPSYDGDSLVAVSDRASGHVRVFDYSNPEKVRCIPERCYNISKGTPGRAIFQKGRLLIPAWNLGILMEELPKTEL